MGALISSTGDLLGVVVGSLGLLLGKDVGDRVVFTGDLLGSFVGDVNGSFVGSSVALWAPEKSSRYACVLKGSLMMSLAANVALAPPRRRYSRVTAEDYSKFFVKNKQ